MYHYCVPDYQQFLCTGRLLHNQCDSESVINKQKEKKPIHGRSMEPRISIHNYSRSIYRTTDVPKIMKLFYDFVQILEQEKHVLRRKLDALEGEYESKVSELQSDVVDLRKTLEDQQNNLKLGERQKSAIVTQLTEQNQRLTVQLKEVETIYFLPFISFT